MVDALSDIRGSGRAWPPTAPEFRAMCLSAGKPKHQPLEAAYSDLCAIMRSQKMNYDNASPILYHTIRRNLDLYNVSRMEEWRAFKAFEIAYKATLFLIECGEELLTPPPPETLLPNPDKKAYAPTSKDIEKGSEVLGSLLSMFDDKPEPKPPTPAEIEDMKRLGEIRNGH